MTIALANKNRQAGARVGGCKNGEVSGETVYKRLQTSKKLKVVTDEDRGTTASSSSDSYDAGGHLDYDKNPSGKKLPKP